MTKINVGLRIPAMRQTNPEAIRAFITRAEDLGFHSIWVGNHIFYHQDVMDSLHQLTWAAAMTRRVRLGTSVMLSAYLNPVLIAKAAASLDCLSGGRLTLGMSIGGTEAEYNSIGVPMNQRVGRLVENVRIMRKLWQEEDGVNYEGRYYTIVDGNIRPKPAQPGGVPIYFGGGSEPMLRRASRIADGWVSGSGGTAKQFLDRVTFIRDTAKSEFGRDPDKLGFVKQHNVSVYADPIKARDEAVDHFAGYYGPRWDVEGACDYGTLDEVKAKLAAFHESDVPEITLALEPSNLEIDHLERIWEATASVR